MGLKINRSPAIMDIEEKARIEAWKIAKNYISFVMKEKKWSQEILAEKLQFSKGYLSVILGNAGKNGKPPAVSLALLIKIQMISGISFLD